MYPALFLFNPTPILKNKPTRPAMTHFEDFLKIFKMAVDFLSFKPLPLVLPGMLASVEAPCTHTP